MNPFEKDLDLTHKINRWVTHHKKHLLSLLFGGILFFGGLGGFSVFQNNKEQEAYENLFTAKGEGAALEKVVLNFPKTKASLLAQLELSLRLLENNNEKQSCEAGFEELYSMNGESPFFRVLALHGLARCQAALKRFTEASATFERAAEEPENQTRSWSRFEAAHVLEWANVDLAKGAYRKLLEEKELPDSLKEEIETRLLWLELQASS